MDDNNEASCNQGEALADSSYYADFATTGDHDGPRMEFGTSKEKRKYLEIGAWSHVNHINTK